MTTSPRPPVSPEELDRSKRPERASEQGPKAGSVARRHGGDDELPGRENGKRRLDQPRAGAPAPLSRLEFKPDLEESGNTSSDRDERRSFGVWITESDRLKSQPGGVPGPPVIAEIWPFHERFGGTRTCLCNHQDVEAVDPAGRSGEARNDDRMMSAAQAVDRKLGEFGRVSVSGKREVGVTGECHDRFDIRPPGRHELPAPVGNRKGALPSSLDDCLEITLALHGSPR
jgi:hypothetical protein